MRGESLRENEQAQIHILEMLTLFWLFFMSATFLIRVNVPDTPSIASDSALEMAAEDAISFGLGTPSLEGNHDSLLAELLAADSRDSACELLQDAIIAGVEGNCWLARDADASLPSGEIGTSSGRTVRVHHLVVINDQIWTVTLDVWHRGGGA